MINRDYIEANKRVYDATADEFEQKIPTRKTGTARVVKWLADELGESDANNSKTVLDLGPGSGWEAKLFSDAGYDVTAIEFSEKMAAVAKRTAPETKMIVDEFMAHDFGNQTYDGIFAMAFIHLFNSEDVLLVMGKIKTLLKPEGIVLISTTLHDKVDEGYMRKTNFSETAKRYRKQYTEAELLKLLRVTEFRVIKMQIFDDKEVAGKRWINLLAQKQR